MHPLEFLGEQSPTMYIFGLCYYFDKTLKLVSVLKRMTAQTLRELLKDSIENKSQKGEHY